MLAQLQSLLTVVILATVAYGLGSRLLRGLGLHGTDPAANLVFSLMTGLVGAGTLLAVLGLVGLLYAPLVGVLTLTGCFWTAGEIVRQRQAGNRSAPAEAAGDSAESDPPRWLVLFALVAAGLAALGCLVGAAAPPTAGDALCYHLELPKAFLADHRLAFYPFSENSTFPLLCEMWFLWAMAMDGPVAAGMVHWLLGLLFAGATAVLAAPIVGRRWAWVAMSAALVVPGVTNQMTAPMNDVALAAATTVALAAWYRAVVLEEDRRWLLVAGIAAGGALAIKYLALLFAAAMVAGCLWTGRRGGARLRLALESAAVIAVVSASVAGLWYARAAWHRGNPVYPFFSEVFPAQGPVCADPHETLPASKSKLGRTPSGALAAAWQVTMHPERLGGRAHQPGVLFLAVLPGLALVRRLRGLGTLLVIGAAYWSAWYLLRQNVRFLLPLIPIAAVAAVWVVAEMRRFPPGARLAGRLLVCGILAAYAGLAAFRCSGQLAVATGAQARADYLALVEPTWRAAEVSNLWFGPRGSLLSTDYRALYFDCPVTRENAFRRHTGYHRQIERPEQLVPLLRGEGFTHLLLVENLGRQGAEFDTTLATLVADCRAVCGPASLPVLADYTFDDLDGGRRRYQLVLVR